MVDRGLKTRGESSVRIAIFHDYFGTIGGGEKVVIAMAKALDADIITTDTDAVRKIDSSVRVISLGKTIKYPGFKQISAMLKFYFSDFSQSYDLFIFSGNWAHYAAHQHHPNIWYCNTPVRAFYDLHESFSKRLTPVVRPFFRLWVMIHKPVDIQSIKNIDCILANSKNVQSRISRYFHRDSELLYPPINVSNYSCKEFGNYWISVNRVYPEKQIELQIETFRQMPNQHLIIIGGFAQGDHASRYAKTIFRNLPTNVTFLGEISEEKLLDHYSRCKALLCTAHDEDFGLTPLEAMASGKPVVTINQGGFKETVTAETGVLVDPEIDSIIKGIELINQDPRRYKEACICRAQEFDIAVFEKNVKRISGH